MTIYRSTKSLYHGLWARQFSSRDHFKALLAVLHNIDPGKEDTLDKLKKVSPFVASFKEIYIYISSFMSGGMFLTESVICE